MSSSTPSLIMERIKVADSKSPIAVFLTSSPDSLDAVFSSTVRCQERIRFDAGYLGSFDKTSHVKKTRLHLTLSLEGK